jgi:chromosome segregation ATPase
MAEAFIEVLLRENNAALKPLLDEYLGKLQEQRRKQQQDIADARQKIPEKEQELKDLQTAFADLKMTHFYRSPDQAQKAIEELNTMLNSERIELAGLLAKRKAIERYRRDLPQKFKDRSTSIKETWEPILRNLEQKYIDLMIDLDVARAREETALDLRQQAQAFLDLSDKVNRVDSEARRLQHDLQQWDADLRALEKSLAHPQPPMLPLQILSNEVRISPVAVELAE